MIFLLLLLVSTVCVAENINPKVNSFTTFSVPNGTNPSASTSSSTMNFTSSDSSVTITGNSSTDTINFQSAGGSAGGTNGQLQYNESGSFGGDTATTDGSGNLSATSVALSSVTASTPAAFNSSKKLVSGSYGSLSSSTTGVSVSGGTGVLFGSGTSISVQTASGSQPGLLAAADWNTFNGKQSALTIGNLTSGTTGVTVSGGTGAVIGSGASVSVQTASGSQPGLLASADWATFNNKAPTASPTFTTAVTLPTAVHGLVEEIDGQAQSPSNTTYYLIQKAKYAQTVNNISVACNSGGSITGSLQIGASNITGCSSLSITTSNQDFTCTASNSISAGGQLTFVTTSNSSCLDLSFSIQTTRN